MREQRAGRLAPIAAPKDAGAVVLEDLFQVGAKDVAHATCFHDLRRTMALIAVWSTPNILARGR